MERVTVFEARELCSGATGRNGGQLTRLPPTSYTTFVKDFGTEQANKIFRFTTRGLGEMHKLAESQGPEIFNHSLKTRVEKLFGYYDESLWLETVDAITAFEEQIPEDRGVYQLVSQEEARTVSDQAVFTISQS